MLLRGDPGSGRASVPIAAALVGAGMSPGTALVFLMAGPATNAATLGSVYKTFGRKVLAIYLTTLIAGSMLLGLAFDFVVPADPVQAHAGHASHPGLLAGLSACVLLALMAWYAAADLRNWFAKRRRNRPGKADQTLSLAIRGMTCPNCARSVRTALLRLPTVTKVTVELESGAVRVQGTRLNGQELSRVVRDAGFEIVAGAV